MEWTNELIINFIKEIEIRPVIWDSSHSEYKNRNRKHDANHELSEKFNCDVTEVLRKWKIILAQFRREKQKIKLSKTSGAGAADIYKPKWFGFQYLQFLQEKDEPSESINSFDDINEQLTRMQEHEIEPVHENEPVSQESQDNITQPFKRPTSKRERHGNTVDSMVSEAFTIMQDMKQKIKERKEDVLEIFSAGVAAKLRKIKNEHIKLLVQRDIDNLLYGALLGTGKYSNTTTPSPYSEIQHFSPANCSPSPTYSRDSSLTKNSTWALESTPQNVEENSELTTECWYTIDS